MNQTVFVAMSGGVDSSVTAYLLQEAGYRVEGIHLELSEKPSADASLEHACLESTCRVLNLPLHYLHLESRFNDLIIANFCEEYSLGRTPNPCVRCNRFIKFGLLLNEMEKMGGDFLATGHYVRLEKREGCFHLLKSPDSTKDQSYFLYVLNQSILKKTLFPLGGMLKSEVKALAAKVGLPAATRRESQDICFVTDNDHKSFLAARIKPVPGNIVNAAGQIVGRHRGLPFYTIGQRQGTGVSAGERLYVTQIEAEKNQLVVGSAEDLLKTSLTAGQLNWVGGQASARVIEVMAKIRYRASPAAAVVEVQGDQAKVHFRIAQKGVAPGQSIVFYQDDEVIGGGVIARAD